MTHLLALDWNHDHCHLLAGTLSRGKVESDHPLVWSEAEPLTLARAEELGKKLKDFLKAAGIAPTPALVTVPRDRVLLKEVRYPSVPPLDEPALVRFQAAKDLLEGGDDVVLDFTRIGDSGGETRTIVAVLKREIVAAHQALCKAAGLKLFALTPRPFVVPGCLEHADIQSTDVAALLWFGPHSAELTLLRGQTVLLSRSFARGESLAADVRRALVLFATQAAANTPHVLFLLGATDAQREELQGLFHQGVLTLKVISLDVGDAKFAGCVGLLQSWTHERLPINFAQPKEVRAAAPVKSNRIVVFGGLAFLAFIALCVICMQALASKRDAIEQAKSDKAEIEDKLKRMAQERTDLEALREWDKANIPWLDEFYDLSARLPPTVGFHLHKIQTESLPRKGKDRFSARMHLTGVTPSDNALVYQYLDSFRDDHLQASIERLKRGLSPEFALKVDVARIAPKSYQTKITLPPPTPSKRSRRD